MERTYTVTDANGRKHETTLAEFKAKVAKARTMGAVVMEAVRRNDIDGCAAAQKSMRQEFA